MEPEDRTTLRRWLLALPGILGLGAFVLFVPWLGWGRAPLLDFGWGWWGAAANVGLVVAFAAHHSGQARRRSAQEREGRLPSLFRARYVFWSGILTGGMVLLWQPLPGAPYWDLARWWAIVPLAACLLLGWSVLSLNGFAFLGLREDNSPPSLRIVGPYRWVRHPQMLGTLIFLWTHPVLTPTLACLAGGLTAYLFLALPWEERDLASTFGAAYRDYHCRVPALIPWKHPVAAGTIPSEPSP